MDKKGLNLEWSSISRIHDATQNLRRGAVLDIFVSYYCCCCFHCFLFAFFCCYFIIWPYSSKKKKKKKEEKTIVLLSQNVVKWRVTCKSSD